MPVKRDKQKITSPFGFRTLNGKKMIHKAVDLRTVNFETWKDQEIIAPEQCEVLRVGVDKLKNNFLVVKPIESYDKGFRELKFIHLDTYAFDNFEIGQIIEKDEFIGFAIEGGSSKSRHLHFETYIVLANKFLAPQNPIEYFIRMGIPYEYK